MVQAPVNKIKLVYKDFTSSYPQLCLEFCRSLKAKTRGFAALRSSIETFGVIRNAMIELGTIQGDTSMYYLLKGQHTLSVLTSMDDTFLGKTNMEVEVYDFGSKNGRSV
jgi:hypothetical protein